MEVVDNEFKLTQKQKEYASFYLHENEPSATLKIQEIRKWIESDDALFARTDDFSIVRFLRSCKFDVEKTKIKLRNYYGQRRQSPEWYADRNPFLSDMQEMFNLGVFLPLKELDEEGRMIILLRTSVHDPHKHTIENVVKAGMMILDIATRSNVSTSLHGVIGIFDMTGVTMSHGLQMTPSVIQKLVHSWQGCYPLRIHSLNFINAPIYVNVVLNIFKKFMSKKLQSKVFIHMKSSKKWSNNLAIDLLPIEYGGNGGTLQELIDYWKNIVEENHDWFKEDEKYQSI
ncbi:hypothetical protein HCN44_001677 [Aphidius gifuensis]|uniref:CRAL-TRIO domain-containing protein n=1 Tax=Aphidius gifuensis TaxID=684658 RepID=A0A834XTR3_APHGI|nr:retinol-binding protein pinta-like [Aphidius gifuensis]KAF7992352.1 hypothetical protein HCN44_001677 [Aphidius gifuensis]